MNESKTVWSLTRGHSPILATAIHHGHHVRPEVAGNMVVDSQTRLREEDPYTGELTRVADNRLVVHRSRFEMDMNRERQNAIYHAPEDAWGIRVWAPSVDETIFRRSLSQYDSFYQMLKEVLEDMVRRHGKVAVLDFHSYNHQRRGPDCPFDDPKKNPEIEVGTDTMNRRYWSELVNRFIADLRRYDAQGRKLDVRENVKFGAGWMSQWIHNHFPTSVCVLSVELKKTYMNEWSGVLYPNRLSAYRQAYLSTIPGVTASLKTIRRRG